VTIPEGVTSIGDAAFYMCKDIEKVTVPDSVTSIDEGAFMNCAKLREINIPNSVATIGDQAFLDCKSLANIIIPDDTKIEGDMAFSGCKKLADPNGFVIVQGVLYNYYGTDTVVTIPDGVTHIGRFAFTDCHELESVMIPDSVTSIGYYAFRMCLNLTRVTIPGSVTHIEESPDKDCTQKQKSKNSALKFLIGSPFGHSRELTIYGPAGSCAAQHAEKYDIPFSAI
jgi:hypothetical protein